MLTHRVASRTAAADRGAAMKAAAAAAIRADRADQVVHRRKADRKACQRQATAAKSTAQAMTITALMHLTITAAAKAR